MSRIREGDPTYAGYVLEEERCGYIVGGVEFAIVDKGRHGNLMEARNTCPVAEGSCAIQGGRASSEQELGLAQIVLVDRKKVALGLKHQKLLRQRCSAG